MKRVIAVALALALGLVSFSALSDEYVRGYTRRDGTYVPPHYRTSPNGTPLDNYSTRGNVNPYTGKPGTVDPYTPQAPSYRPPSMTIRPTPVQPPSLYGTPPDLQPRPRPFGE